ncbi:MAG: signal peptide peptidase SppA [Crocinitomicaceae bacterium]|nr:signal peptide peptidase SppA [Crocinitomicaceae bacterium]|tara:strand:- start:12 stop:1817 length:1806 start_codon:yes stop_codon:yes gene_type:complete
MRPFWRSFWASIFAYIVLSAFVILIINVVIFSLAGTLIESKEFKISKNSYLEMNLDFNIQERSGVETSNNLQNPISKSYGIHEVISILEKAENDEEIKGIVLKISKVNMGLSTIDNLRNALKDFKKSGKFIVGYEENFSLGAYYLSSVSENLYLYPEGMIDFRGLGSELMFFKKAIDKLDLDVQIIRGKENKFKGAVEPFMYEKMSSENRLQIQNLLDDVWLNMTNNIKESRNISLEKLNLIADSIYSYNAIGCQHQNLVDGLIYEDQLDSIIRMKMKIDEDQDFHKVSFKKYLQNNSVKTPLVFGKEIVNKTGNIAIVYAVGDIISGESNSGSMGSKTIVKAVNKAKNDSSIKAVVLRVNSPGGSALASDVIWRSIEKTKEVKPVIVSMGDVAASGGYYISCGADRIFAEPNTITGSIGVFGMIPNFGKMMENKIGITFDRVETNEHAAFSMFGELDKKELSIFQKGVDEIYDTFISKVANGRDGLKKSDVHQIAKGRVWSGKEALSIQLIDEIGTLNSAIIYAANKVGINEDGIQIIQFPKVKNDELLELLSSIEFQSKSQNEISELIKNINNKFNKSVKSSVGKDKFQTIFPFEIRIF